MSFSRLLRFFSDHLSITSSNSSAPKIMASNSTSSIALLGVILMASSTLIYYFYSKASSNSFEPKKEESSSNSSAPEKEESSSNSSAPEKEESSSNSSEPKKEESPSDSSEPKKEESSSDSSEPKKEESSSNSTTPTSFKYGVFLSFRGADTRNNFLSHLYEALTAKGIATYKDDVKIRKGKTISDELIKAIEDSRFYIIVFSKNYASSSWCLDELVKIMECRKMTGHTAYPVFYDVEPTEVRYQSGAVENAFSKNKEKEDAEKWKGALKEAASLAGWELKNTLDGDEAKFIKTIVQQIFLELRPINSGFDKMLVGMETRVKGVVDSLKMEIDDVRMIGIKGMGGAGKTTTARAIFDHLFADFEAKSFVENVREVSTKLGLNKLQEQVLKDVLNEHVTVNAVTNGKIMMKNRMSGMKVLLVLDDVNHIDQLEALAGGPNWFKPGSRIIVTTRDEQVLVAHRVKLIPEISLLSDKEAICLLSRDEQVLEAQRVNVIRDIDLLSDKEAMCLLSRYAFGKDIPSQGYKELSGKVVRYAAGLPLTVKVLGSFLCGKDKHEWKDAIERLKEIPLQETQEKLELSYTSLENDYKEIFLDIACMMKGWGREYAIRILECCGFRAINGLKVLEQRSLITISEDGELGMHDHIEEMGKNIVRREHPNEPNKHSRLWIKEEVEDILANDKGTEATRCLELHNSNTNAGTVMKGLGKMKQLRYLQVYFTFLDYYQIDAGCLDDTSQYFSNSLKYLKFENYPFLYLPKTFQANNLVGLEMKNSRMVQLWEEGEKKVLKKLKFLILHISNLTTFDFSMTPSLETLILRCDKLVKLCTRVSCQELKHLDISHSKLRTFDLDPRFTPNLETLSLKNCADFEELHVSSACPNLKFLELCKSRLRSLDLELFPNLERLDLGGCHQLVEINAPVGCLRKLVYLNLNRCLRFSYFVVPAGELEPKDSRSSASLRLVSKSQDLCRLHPNSNLPKLQFRCYYKDLPSSIGNIEKLISFGLCACTDFKKFSDMICSLRCLRTLQLECDIPEFPKDLGKLECLEELILSSTKIQHLPDSICMLKCLKSLKVDNGDLFEKLPENLGQLECLEELYVRSKKIEFLPDSICMQKRLKSLDVEDCSCLGKLPENIGQLESLESLNLSGTKIKHLPDSICMLKHLNYLNLLDCALLEKLPEDLGKLECLEVLYVSSKKIEFLPDSICMLKHLKLLDVGKCSCLGKLPEDIGQLESLERLDLTATMIKHLPDSICELKHLTHLNVRLCTLLEKLPENLGQLECLEELHVRSTKIEYLPDSICMLKRLKSLNVRDCSCLGKLPEDIGKLECLEELCLSATKIKHLPDSICELKHLTYLNLYDCALLEKIPEDLRRLECFKDLYIAASRELLLRR